MYQVHQQHDSTTSLRKGVAAPQPHVSGAHTRNVQVYPVNGVNSDRPSTSSSSTSTSSSSFHKQQQHPHPVVASVTPRSTSSHPQYMGASTSKPTPPLPSPSPPIVSSTTTAATNAAVKGINAAVAGGIKLKRAFAARRKKSEDATTALSKGKEPEFMRAPVPVSENVNGAGLPRLHPVRRGNASPSPPTPPEKDSTNSQTLSLPPAIPAAQNRSSVMAMSPTISSAVNYMIADANKQESARTEKIEKESWRKSDSTNSHHTIRPGAMTAKSSRPASWAESFQSGNTVVQVKRISLMADAEFVMAEEDFDDADDVVVHSTSSQATTTPTNTSHKTSPQSKRRSISLNMGVPGTARAPTPSHSPYPQRGASATDLKQPSLSISEGVPPPHSPQPPPRVPRNASPPASYPSQSGSNDHNPRRAAWAAASANPSIISAPSSSTTSLDQWHDRSVPALPNQRMRAAAPMLSSNSTAESGNTSFRQTTISVTASGMAAAGFAKRAVEKMGKKWAIGMGISTSSSGSGYSSPGSSSTAPTSFTDYSLARTSSNQSQPSLFGGHRRTPGGGGVGTTSVSSSISGSDSDPFAVTAPHFGQQLRSTFRTRQGGVASGVVFGRDLASVVRDTSISVGRKPGSPKGLPKEGLLAEIEERALPALVVRCAQHLLVWGIKEEGLFRLTGRPSHTSRLRAEFDSGADYDMIECTPGDLDPHAVSSVFKAFLRELPEPVLTQKLLPYFDAALSKENTRGADQPLSPTRMSLRPGAGLPTGPKMVGAIRKPPSLSTLAMPSFQGIPPPSRTFVNAVRSLVEQLPLENRDLLRTIVDLIQATSKECKETKMPLSNLLVVFCPSLNMTPPLLKVLCEAEGVWGARLEDSPILDIRRHTVLDIAPPTPSKDSPDDDDAFSDASTGPEEDQSLSSSRGPSEDLRSSDYHASSEDVRHNQRRWGAQNRPEVPTVYLDTQSHLSSSVSSLPLDPSPTADLDIPVSRHSRDPADNGSISSEGYSENNVPLLSSSAESVATPTSSGNPSFADIPVSSSGEEKVDLHTSLPKHPQIADPTPLDLVRNNQARPPSTSSPKLLRFPTSAQDGSVPPSPSKRRSIPILSLSGFSSSNDGGSYSGTPSPKSTSSGPVEGTGLRAKKPSLKLLFKRSNSSLKMAGDKISAGLSQISAPILQRPSTPSTPYRQSPRSASDSSSISTPDSAVTAPQSGIPGMQSSSHLSSLLDLTIDDSSLNLGLGFDVSPPVTATHQPDKNLTVRTVIATDGGYETEGPVRTPLASASRLNQSSTSPTSPYRTVIKPGENHLRMQQPNVSTHSVASSHQLSLFEDDEHEDDWSKSVLLAADVNGQWSIQRPGS